ncbi:MAG: tRNA pseudouridine(55) synthase TruB [Lachnospiraceae bacterium]|nr:tRNA pseudouridine(55) synthase TruB [Lachnospiraceae bacterium]
MNGVLIVAKEKGYTSHDVVARLRGILHQKKIGHTGTLDPDATGVLPVCLGNATKLCDFLTDKRKTYEAVMLLGMTTDTYDTSGVMLTKTDPSHVTPEALRDVMGSFLPGYDQVPPMVSAKKVDGKRLYELARKGITVERKAVPVTLSDLKILSVDLPRVRFQITCSKGTYIRSLIHDMGQRLQCGAVMEDLVRLSASGYDLKDALTLDEIEARTQAGTIGEVLIATDAVLGEYPALQTEAAADALLSNGNPFPEKMAKRREVNITQPKSAAEVDIIHNGHPVRVYDSAGKFAGLFRYDKGSRMFRVVKMFPE